MKGFAIVVSLTAALCSANAQSLRSQIDTSSKAVRKYMMAKDVKGFTKYMRGGVTSDFMYEEDGRTMNFDKMCAGMSMGLGQMKKLTRADAKIVTLHQNGNTATATTMHVMEGIVVGADKKTHKMSFSGTSTDSYVKRGQKWKMSKMAWGQQSVMYDGKPMNAMTPGRTKGK